MKITKFGRAAVMIIATLLLQVMPAMEAFAQAIALRDQICPPGQKEVPWNNPGGNKYASTVEEAMQKREDAFRRLGLPEDVIELALFETENPGAKHTILNGDRMLAMVTGSGVMNCVVADFKNPSPNMEQTAPAKVWRLTRNNVVYVIILPDVCNNWSYYIEDVECFTLTFNAYPKTPLVRVENVRWGIGTSAPEPLPPSECSAQKQGSGNWTAWWGECTTCQVAVDHMERLLGTRVQVFQKYLYPVTHERQSIRFPRSIQGNVVYVCLEYEDGTSSCGAYVGPSWEVTMEIPDSIFSLKDCPE